MPKYRFAAIAVFCLSIAGCGITANTTQRSALDVKLIGMWSGEYLEEGGTLKSWIQTRNADGTYSINFSFKEPNGSVKSFTEAGHWWIKENLFHELATTDMAHPDKYRYTFLDKHCVRFQLFESDGYAEDIDSYTFTECLIADSPPATFSETI